MGVRSAPPPGCNQGVRWPGRSELPPAMPAAPIGGVAVKVIQSTSPVSFPTLALMFRSQLLLSVALAAFSWARTWSMLVGNV